MKISLITKLSIVVNLLLTTLLLVAFIKLGGFNRILGKAEAQNYDENIWYIERTDLFRGIKLQEGGVILVGDSLTQRGLWDEYFPDIQILNRGINSDTLDGLLSRQDVIVEAKPSKVFIMIGINDLYSGDDIMIILSQYEELLQAYKSQLPDTEIYIQSLLPLNYEMYFAGDKIKNEEIKEVNTMLAELAAKYNYAFIDLNSHMLSGSQLNSDLTWDGIHMNAKGYQIWVENISQYIYE